MRLVIIAIKQPIKQLQVNLVKDPTRRACQSRITQFNENSNTITV